MKIMRVSVLILLAGLILSCASGPTDLPVADEADAAILTWPDLNHPYIHLYYARLDNQGNVLTAPTIYRQTRGNGIRSFQGYGVGGLPPAYQVYLPVVLRSFP